MRWADVLKTDTADSADSDGQLMDSVGQLTDSVGQLTDSVGHRWTASDTDGQLRPGRTASDMVRRHRLNDAMEVDPS